MKILYVEDNPSENVDRIIFLFRKYLKKEIVEELGCLDDDDSGYGVSADDIKRIINSSGTIWFEYNFYQVLKILNDKQHEFSLFIIDRNLRDSDYDIEEIKKIEPLFSDEMFIEYDRFEGDYLLHKLIYDKIDVINKFFFLTANSKDGLKELSKIEQHIQWGKFSKDNFIDKTNSKQCEKLRNIINKHKKMNIQHENSFYLKVLAENVGQDAKDKFLDLLISDDRNYSDACVDLRKILEAILTTLANETKIYNPDCWRKSRGKKEIKLSKYINYIIYDESEAYHTNSIIEESLMNIKIIGSEEAHVLKQISTVNTVQAMIYNLKDIIIWFDGVIGK